MGIGESACILVNLQARQPKIQECCINMADPQLPQDIGDFIKSRMHRSEAAGKAEAFHPPGRKVKRLPVAVYADKLRASVHLKEG